MLVSETAEQLVSSLHCPPGASMEDIQALIAGVHQKDVVLQPVSDDYLSTITGLWVETEAASHVFYRDKDPILYQAHSIFHEFGHILADHQTCGVLDFIDNTDLDSQSLGGQIQRARARGFQHDEAENLAEEIAYALSRVLLAGATSDMRAVFE